MVAVSGLRIRAVIWPVRVVERLLKMINIENIKVGQVYRQVRWFKPQEPYLWTVIKKYKKPKKILLKNLAGEFEAHSYGKVKLKHDGRIEELGDFFICSLELV